MTIYYYRLVWKCGICDTVKYPDTMTVKQKMGCQITELATDTPVPDMEKRMLISMYEKIQEDTYNYVMQAQQIMVVLKHRIDEL